MDKVSEIYRLAALFRREIARSRGSFPKYLRKNMADFPRGSCDHASALLGRFLLEKGFAGVEYINNGRRGKNPEESHAWLEIDGIIVDITADQFADQPESIMVTRDRSWHATFHGQRRQPVSCQLRFNEPLTWEYEIAYAGIRKALAGR